MKRAIRKRLPDFAAILALMVLGAAVGGYIMSNQRLTLPAWVPIVGEDVFVLKGEFQTGQALTPGQGQTVNIAGVQVGEIQEVVLEDGRALVTMKIDRKFAEGRGGRPAIYRDATMLLRPKTGLKDMIVELSPGTPSAGRMPDGGVVPVANTLPDVNPDEVLATLDADTRELLVALVNGAGEGLDGRSRDLSNAIRRFEPTARDTLRVTEALAERRANVRRVTTNFRRLAEALAGKDRDLAGLVDSSNAVFQSLAAQEANIRATLQELPPTLAQTQTTLADADRLADTLGPTAEELRPSARALAPALRDTRPFLRESLPIIRDDLRPFTRIAQPIVADLRPVARQIEALTPDLTSVFRTANYLVNELAHNPEGPEEGYLYWLAWVNHAGGTIFNTQDAHGVIRRGLFLASCDALPVFNALAQAGGLIATLVTLQNLPNPAQVCPATSRSAP